ncbi:hypothetical protein PIROE2DRAFT_2530 [Piromyces sp. E2]|nr:hypothetical protein PIROE2DRAFT_2530 [Piromyces sp. E2]|eukprot:OUM69444.1 hypothetical protein PIROE2DRAFT_2530 [Piromyces sp. E2]
MEDLYGEDINGGNTSGAFTLNHSSVIELVNIELNNVRGSGYGGLLFNSYNEINGSMFKVINGTFSNFYQNYEKPSSTFIWSPKNVKILLKNSSEIILENVVIEGYYTKTSSAFIRSECYEDLNKNILYITDFTLNNYQGIGSFICFDSGEIILNRINLKNIYSCKYSNYSICDNNYYSTTREINLIEIYKNTQTTLKDSKFESMFIRSGFNLQSIVNINVENCEITNNYFDDGFIYIGKINVLGTYSFNNTKFSNNRGYDGTILNISDSYQNVIIAFNECEFNNNIADHFGGIIYSNNYDTDKRIFFFNCKFSNNYASLGNNVHIS